MEAKEEIYLHSRIDPTQEKILFDNEKAELLICVGFGLGYGWNLFFQQKSQDIVIFAESYELIERQPDLFEAIVGVKLMLNSNNITSNRVTIFPIDTLRLRWSTIPNEYKSTSVLVRPWIKKLFPDYISWMEPAQANQVLLSKKITQGHFAISWHKNFLEIVKNSIDHSKSLFFLQESGFQLNSKIPIFIAGASSHLDRFLKIGSKQPDFWRRILIIATDSAETTLRQMGAAPDVVISADASPFNLNQYSGKSGAETWYLSPLMIRERLFLGKGYIALPGTHPLEQLLLEFLNHPVLQLNGGHVGELALHVSFLFSNSPVFVAGMDLSYPNGETYSGGTPYNDFFMRNHSRLKSMELSMIEQLARLKAYKKDGLYRRTSLDESLEKLNKLIQLQSVRQSITFIGFPQQLQSLLPANHLSFEEGWQKLHQLAEAETTDKQKILLDRFTKIEIPSNEIKKFLSFLPEWQKKEHIYNALFDHWPDHSEFMKKRMILKTKHLSALKG